MRLVIVESPNKTKKIRDFLGPGYRVAASFGHIRDLPAAGGLSVSFRDGRVEPHYQPLERAGRAIADLISLARQADEILLATDPDREGEAIAWHIAQILSVPCRRVTFHAITKAAVLAAIAQPRAVDQHLVDAQQARRVLDRVVGWLVSPTLWQVGKDAKSAGRVQSVALRFVAEREREIQAFQGADYFTLLAKLERPETKPSFNAELVTWKGEPLKQRLVELAIAEKTVAWCRKQPWQVQACERREAARHAPPPFTTATVQQAASVRLGLNPDVTMKQLQQLFEDGHITYHRTDSVALEPDAVSTARTVISRDFPAKYLPAQPLTHGQKNANAQEAHEAIRPTHADTAATIPGEAGALYRLIWERFIACQMASGRDQLTTIDIACAPGTFTDAKGVVGPMGIFQAKGKVVLFDGWRRLTGDATEETKDGAKKKGRPKKGAESAEILAELPLLNPGDGLNLLDLLAKQKSTKPPPRYTQASLIKKLEGDGIGRPSTYAPTLKTILDRGYIGEDQRMLYATELGLRVTDFLIARYAGNFIEKDYTARLEGRLDAIARGEADWQHTVTSESFAILAAAQRAGLRGNPLGSG
jgi:DNA topoisomerase-1